MALEYDLRSCADSETLMDPEHWGVTEVMIFATMFLHMSGITEKNWKEFFIRLNMYERAFGALTDRPKHPFITPDEVRARIGLSCNTNDSKAKFSNGLIKALRREAERVLRGFLDTEAKEKQPNG